MGDAEPVPGERVRALLGRVPRSTCAACGAHARAPRPAPLEEARLTCLAFESCAPAYERHDAVGYLAR